MKRILLWPAILAVMSVFSLKGSAEPPAALSLLPEAELRFLWPADPDQPGEKLEELSGREKKLGKMETPLGSLEAMEVTWTNAQGGTPCRSRFYFLPESDGFSGLIIETELLEGLHRPTGRFERPHFALPAITPKAQLRHTLAFVETAFAPPTRRPTASTGPTVFYSDDLEVLIVSPLDHFLTAIQAPAGKCWHSAFEGLIEEIPPETVHRMLLVSGRGINAGFARWGEWLRGWWHHPGQDPYADVALSYLGYWTDNGAYYYYKTAPGLNEHETLLAVRDDARTRGIPYGYFQIDSWWYPKAGGSSLLSAFRGGSLVWEPIPEKFPAGLTAFQKELGLPLVAHNRWYDADSPYCRRYECVYGRGAKQPGLPIEPDFWDELMDTAVSYGVAVYEQDWLVTQMDLIPWLRAGLDHADAKWFDVMAQKAHERGLTMQLCMASPGFFLQQVKHPNITHVRASGDYQAGVLKHWFWPNFHTTSLLAAAVGLWPFKDNFQSSPGQRLIRSERWPLEEALISSLSGGPVGPSDKIGAADRELLLHTCRADGLLLKPDRPATPVDLMFVSRCHPWIVTTESRHELGTTFYLAAFNLWPHRLRRQELSLSEVGLSGEYAVLTWRTHELQLRPERLTFGQMPLNEAFYFILVPLLENGMAVLGEPDKFITLSRKRFPSLQYREGEIFLEVEGVLAEEVRLWIYSPKPLEEVDGATPAGRPVDGVTELRVKMPAEGRTRVVIR